jgi:hypothetical protein
MHKITLAQARHLSEILSAGGVVAASDWTSGKGKYTTCRAVPPFCQKLIMSELRDCKALWSDNGAAKLRGEVARAFKRLLRLRPRLQYIVAVTDLRGARRAVKQHQELAS